MQFKSDDLSIPALAALLQCTACKFVKKGIAQIVPCNHLICRECGQEINKCPICERTYNPLTDLEPDGRTSAIIEQLLSSKKTEASIHLQAPLVTRNVSDKNQSIEKLGDIFSILDPVEHCLRNQLRSWGTAAVLELETKILANQRFSTVL